MKFDESKVISEWSDELKGKKGWFSDYINDEDEQCLRSYVETNSQIHYGLCHKGEENFPFREEDGIDRSYFYPDETAKFDKENLFIAGYNDEVVNIGDEGILGETVIIIQRTIKDRYDKSIGKLLIKNEQGFSKDGSLYRPMFYRTKCAPKKKYVPWTKDNFPLHVLSLVRSKVDTDFTTFIGGLNICKNTINIGSADDPGITFEELFDYWELPDGTPCGQEVTE